jgi:hypothetical protein
MPDEELQQTTMRLSEDQQEVLDELAYSRTEAVRILINEHDEKHPAEDIPNPEDRCPECGRQPVLIAACGSLSVRSADESVIDYCRSSEAADWLFVHEA